MISSNKAKGAGSLGQHHRGGFIVKVWVDMSVAEFSLEKVSCSSEKNCDTRILENFGTQGENLGMGVKETCGWRR